MYRFAQPVALAPPVLHIPQVLSSLPAGFPSPADDYLEEGVDLNRLLIQNPPASFLFRVTGDSMDRVGILSGDRVVVDRSVAPLNGHIVVALLEDAHTIKRLRYHRGQPVLVPESHNPAHKPRYFKDGEELVIWGVVTSVLRQVAR